MKKYSLILATIALVAILFAGCDKENEEGTITLSLTDAPIDSDDIVGVYITVTDVQYHLGGSDFESFPEFVGPQTYNLLDLTRGESAMMGTLPLAAGHYTQVRFVIDAPERGMGTPSSPGCYL